LMSEPLRPRKKKTSPAKGYVARHISIFMRQA
jgi:hypothetical protein